MPSRAVGSLVLYAAAYGNSIAVLRDAPNFEAGEAPSFEPGVAPEGRSSAPDASIAVESDSLGFSARFL